MKYLLFVIKTAFLDFSRSKGRTFLTSLGILIGVLAVVLLTAFGLGLRAYIQQQFDALGSNLIRVVPGSLLQNGNFSPNSSLGAVSFDEQDALRLRRVKYVRTVVPVYTKSVTVEAGRESEFSSIYSSTADIFTALNVKAEYGTLFTEREVNKRSKIVVIGPKLAENLFGSAERALSKSIKINNHSFKVIGITEKKGGGGFGGPDFDTFVYMPYKTGYVFNTKKEFQAIIIQTTKEDEIPTVKRLVEQTMLKKYEKDDFSVIEQQELIGAISSIFGIINTVLVAIAAISLLVGGIGIMNIMYVSVTERIKEIGIRRALGARKSDILSQFLVESIILSLLGGLSGLILAYVIVFFIKPYFPAYIDAGSVALALGVSSGIGIIFGVFPAKKAADLSPIDAIRYE